MIGTRQIEWTRVESVDDEQNETSVRVLHAVQPGQWVRDVGSDAVVGELVLPAGSVLEADDIGLLASFGVQHVEVNRRVKVAVASTGDELVTDCGPLKTYGQIQDSNRPMLIAALHELGVEVVDLGIVKDSAETVASALSTAVQTADVLITSGGVSMGEKDYVKPWLDANAHLRFGRVCMKPGLDSVQPTTHQTMCKHLFSGKPTTFGTVVRSDGNSSLVFALPGNPVSALVTFRLFVERAIRVLQNLEELIPPTVQAKTSSRIRLDPERPE